MYKKLISMTLAFVMFLSMGTIANATGYQIASGEDFNTSDNQNVNTAPGGINNTDNTGNTGSTDTNGRSGNNASSPLKRHTDTIDNSTPIVEQNRTKNNDMLNADLPKEAVPSRYSNERVVISPDISGTKYEEAAEILGALGIMVGDAESGLFRPNDNILRSEMAKVAVYSVGLEDVANGMNSPTRFPDVASNHWANGAINVAEQQGMVIGDDVGTFRPDDNVLFQEAVTIMVRALGYEPRATASGSYPTGYMVTASSIQLLKGINVGGAEPAKRGDIAQLVFNALTINMMEQTGFGSDVSFEVGTKTLLYDRLNVEKGYGQIKGTHETSLTGGSTTSEDQILINDQTFLESNTTAKQLLGYNVVYYARIDTNTDQKTLIVVRPQDTKNKTLKIDASNISNITGDTNNDKTLTYWETNESNTTKTATIVANPTYILNGKYAANVALERLKVKSGNLILLDTDVNNIYDIVFINELTNLVVDTVSTVTGRVTDKYNGNSLLLDPEDESIIYSIILDNYDIELEDLDEWDVLSYTISEDKALIKAYVSRESILGTVTQLTTRGIKFDTAEGVYEIAANYPNEINIRDRGRFYLDIEGKIAAVDETASGTEGGNATRGNYGYLVDAAITGTIDRVLQLKLFTTAGETTVFDTTEKVRVDNNYGQTAEQVLSVLGKDTVSPQLITYETNAQGKITGIDLAVDVTETGAPNVRKFSKNIIASDQVYKSASRKLGNVTITDETIVFDIPEGAGEDTTQFAVRSANFFSNDTPYDIIVYDLQEDYSARVIIVTSTTGITNPESPIFVVSEISSGQNEDFEEIDIVTGYENGKLTELNSTGKTVFVKGDQKLEAGDVFQYNTNADGDVDAITLLFDVDQMGTEFTREVTTDLTTVYGRAVKRFTGSVNVDVNGAVRNYSTANATVYSFNSAKKNNKVTVVTPADIELYEEGNEVRVFLKLYKDEVTEIVIVR